MRRGHRLLPPRKRDIRLTLNGRLVDKRYVTMDSYNRWVYGNEPVSITLPAQSGDGGTSWIEPDYYPDYAENEDVAPAAAPAKAAASEFSCSDFPPSYCNSKTVFCKLARSNNFIFHFFLRHPTREPAPWLPYATTLFCRSGGIRRGSACRGKSGSRRG